MKDFEKRIVSKNGKRRITAYRDDYAENPRDMTDEPLHCEDWSRDYSIMTKQDKESRSCNARDLCEYFLLNFGNREKILSLLIENGKRIKDGNWIINNALVYEPTLHAWVLKEYIKLFYKNDYSWRMAEQFECKKDEIDIDCLLEALRDSTINYLIEEGCLTDGVKAMSYSFGYNGVSFDNEVTTDSVGVAWLEKDEFLKYSGCDEKYWKEHSLKEIEHLLGELEAWSEWNVYYITMEERFRVVITKHYVDEDMEDEVREEDEWEVLDSCGGFYGEVDEALNSFCDSFGENYKDYE